MQLNTELILKLLLEILYVNNPKANNNMNLTVLHLIKRNTNHSNVINTNRAGTNHKW